MELSEPTAPVRAWRNRLTGRVPFDRSAAEAAIRRVYDTCGLAAPNQILWAGGPVEAAQTVAFVESPPKKLRRIAVAVVALGAALWILLGLAIHSGAFAAQSPVMALISSVILGIFGLALGGLRPLPIPPAAARRRAGRLFIPAAMVFVALTGYSYALQRLGGFPPDPVGHATGFAVAALVGSLPGLFFLARIRSVYAHISRSLTDLAPSASIASHLERTREKAWAPFQRVGNGPRPDRSLMEAHRSAFEEAIARHDPRLPLFSRLVQARQVQARQTPSWDVPGWTTNGGRRNVYPAAADAIPRHLDGIEDIARAAAVERAGAIGAAAAFADLAFHVDRLYPYRTIAVAVLPAATVALDAEGRPHAEDGPALGWADGTRLHAWHGQLIAADVLDRSEPVTLLRVDREMDPDRRWVLIERYGLGRYLLASGATEVQCDGCGRLYRLEQRMSEPIVAVRVVNRTPEPDGSTREFWLRVPPAMTTARQAVAWTFDMSTDQYEPLSES